MKPTIRYSIEYTYTETGIVFLEAENASEAKTYVKIALDNQGLVAIQGLETIIKSTKQKTKINDDYL